MVIRIPQLFQARANKSKDKPDSELDEFSRILEEHRTQGAEDQALERRVETKKAAAAKKRGAGGAKKSASSSFFSIPFQILIFLQLEGHAGERLLRPKHL